MADGGWRDVSRGMLLAACCQNFPDTTLGYSFADMTSGVNCPWRAGLVSGPLWKWLQGSCVSLHIVASACRILRVKTCTVSDVNVT